MQIHESLSSQSTVGRFFVAKGSLAAVYTLRILAAVLSVFGKYGQQASEALSLKARKIYAIHVKHPQLGWARPPLQRLARSINIATRSCIAAGEDIRAAEALRAQLLKKGVPESEGLKKVKFKGAKTNGICCGVTQYFLKRLSETNVTSEKQLQSLSEGFEEGFPAEAAAYQELYAKGVKIRKAEIAKELAQLEKELKGMKNLSTEQWKKKAAQLKERLKMNSKEELQFNSALTGISYADPTDFANLESDKELQQKFDLLSLGKYALSFKAARGAHEISYLKFPFGSYLMDPNIGLMRCEGKPSLALIQLLNSYGQIKNRTCMTMAAS